MRLTYSRLGLYSLRLRAALLACWLCACSSDGSRPPGEPDGNGIPPVEVLDGGTADAARSDMDARSAMDASKLDPSSIRADGAICVALGCDELNYECGQTVDNCGDPLNCNLANNATPCLAPNRCGGDPDLGAQRCGCKPRSDACAAEAAQCGLIDECGMQVDCGNCSNGSVCLSNSCNCTAVSDPCGTKVCGSAPDGCGATVACGPSNGACSVGVCGVDGQCACPPSAAVCVGQTGPIMQNGCSYDCTTGPGGCVADNVTACAGAECGTARNNCGDTVACGAAAGACAAGNTCIGPQFVLDSALPARSGSYGGGYCVADGIAKVLGKYAVRVHAFREAGNSIISFINRAESISLVLIQYTRATGLAHMTDNGCVATTIGDPSSSLGGSTHSVVPKYRNLPAVSLDLAVSSTTLQRPDPPNPILGTGTPGGYAPGIPSFCAGLAGTSVALPAGNPRIGTWWPDNMCTCPSAPAPLPAKPGASDPNNYSTAVLRDCRIIDDDLDGKAGFTAVATAPILGSNSIYNANISHGTWTTGVRDDRFHVGFASEAVSPIQRVVLGCASTGGACDVPAVDCGCANRWSTVQFVPLADSATLDCNAYYASGDSVSQTAIDSQFSVGYGSCSGPGQCPAGSLCRANKCFSITSKGACTAGSSNPCPAGSYCEGCPDDPSSPETETSCRADTACWPTTNECPIAGSGVGGYCVATPP